MFARVFLFLALAVGLVAGGVQPIRECAQRVCGCCVGAKRCCVVDETSGSQAPLASVQEPSLNLKVALVPLIELFQNQFSLAPRVAAFAPAKPARLPSSACIEFTCVRLI
jgi:hypothetical protein